MTFPDFYDDVPRLRMHDPLADMLGGADGGVLEYGYADAVRLTGHSCPTVAAAYWLTRLALRELYPYGLPERGGVRVEFRDNERDGSTGIVALIVQMITGASGDWGFKGVSGRYSRAGLLRFKPDLPLSMRYTRLDNGSAVDVGVDLALLAADERLDALLARLRKGHTDAALLRELGALWQGQVRQMLIDRRDDPGLFIVHRLERWRADHPTHDVQAAH